MAGYRAVGGDPHVLVSEIIENNWAFGIDPDESLWWFDGEEVDPAMFQPLGPGPEAEAEAGNRDSGRASSRAESITRAEVGGGASGGGSESITRAVAEADPKNPCAICFDDMKADASVFKCKTCKNSVHYRCWTAWNREGHLTCVHCRAIAPLSFYEG